MFPTLATNDAPASKVSVACGCCVIIGPLDLTVIVELVPVTPLSVALMVALPELTAVTLPLASTARTLGLLLVQLVIKPVTGTPETAGKFAVAEAGWVRPAEMVELVTVTMTDVGTKLVATTPGPANVLAAR